MQNAERVSHKLTLIVPSPSARQSQFQVEAFCTQEVTHLTVKPRLGTFRLLAVAHFLVHSVQNSRWLGRRLLAADSIGMSPIAVASRALKHVTIDSLAVQLSFHFVRHSQALGNAA